MTHYIGILDGSHKVWGVRVPDLPGCHGGGDSAEAAISNAVSAALEWAEHRHTRSAALPPPRQLDQIIKDEGAALSPNEMAVMIPILLDRGRPVRANLSIDAGLLEAIDNAAKTRGLTRSAFIASAAREKILAEG